MERSWPFWAACLFGMGLKEDVAVFYAMLGLSIALSEPRRKLGWGLFGLAATWAVLSIFVFIPHFNEAGSYTFFDRITLLSSSGEGGGATLSGLAATAFERIAKLDKLRYLGHLAIPLAFLWLRGGWWLMPAAPILAWISISTNWLEYAFFVCQYPTLPLTALFIATGWAGHRKSQTSAPGLGRWAFVLLVASLGFHLCLAEFMEGSRIVRWISPSSWGQITKVSEDSLAMREYLEALPKDATVWCEPCFSLFVANPVTCHLTPPVHPLTEEIVATRNLYLAVRPNQPGSPDWAQDLIKRSEPSLIWEEVWGNAEGTVFRSKI